MQRNADSNRRSQACLPEIWDLAQRLLAHPVNHSGYTQRTFTRRSRLVNFNPAYRLRAITPTRQPLLQNHEITAMLALEPVNTDPVHTTSTPVFPHTLPRPLQITRVMNLTDQRVRLPHLHTFPRYLAVSIRKSCDGAGVDGRAGSDTLARGA